MKKRVINRIMKNIFSYIEFFVSNSRWKMKKYFYRKPYRDRIQCFTRRDWAILASLMK
ncbi:MAG: hypothetical protein P9M03_10140 [Candidatus Theseobacter exili]|nr:hypothetical protein [Candidatus Theseobacter exili]